MKRAIFFTYGVIAYLCFLGTFLYAIGFVGNAVVPKAIDGGSAGALSPAMLVNLVLLGAFGIQHSVMARPAFKRWWTTIIPAPIERSTFVLIASLLLILMFWQWRPMPAVVWRIESAAVAWVLHAVSGLGWALVVYATFLIDHFDLFGLRQVYLFARGEEYSHKRFHTPSLYRWVRHPLMLGFIIAFWSTPVMTQGHLLFAGVTTLYILVAIHIEERDLVGFFGEQYLDYRRQTSMIIPWPRRAAAMLPMTERVTVKGRADTSE
jgi:protein-S-isoprenylcysteine O-methyltransferase Ste14